MVRLFTNIHRHLLRKALERAIARYPGHAYYSTFGPAARDNDLYFVSLFRADGRRMQLTSCNEEGVQGELAALPSESYTPFVNHSQTWQETLSATDIVVTRVFKTMEKYWHADHYAYFGEAQRWFAWQWHRLVITRHTVGSIKRRERISVLGAIVEWYLRDEHFSTITDVESLYYSDNQMLHHPDSQSSFRHLLLTLKSLENSGDVQRYHQGYRPTDKALVTLHQYASEERKAKAQNFYSFAIVLLTVFLVVIGVSQLGYTARETGATLPTALQCLVKACPLTPSP
jgi:hypothetical protein